MSNIDGWIKIHRKMLDWEWFTEANTAHFFQYCLLSANTTDRVWRGITIERGSFISSLPNMSEQTGLTIRSIRTAISRLISTHELTCETTHKYTKIIVCNYDKYQLVEQSKRQSKRHTERQTDDMQTTCERHANDTNIRIEEYKEDIEENNISFSDEKESEVETSRPKKKKYTAEETKMHSDCRAIFEEKFQQLNNEKYYWTAKDAGAMVGVLKQIRFFMPEEKRGDIAELTNNFRIFLDVIIRRADSFTLKKFSLPYINGNFNEIYNAIKDNNGKSANNSSTGGFGYSATELADVLANLQS